MTETTLLGLSRAGFELSDYAARGISMTMEPIGAAGNVRRDVNGNLVNLSQPQMQKYAFKISCTDQESPGFAEMSSEADAIWPGDIFELTCIPQLGSSASEEQQEFTVMVMAPGWQVQTDEYNADVGWSLDLEQV